MKAVWNDQIIAESDNCIEIEGNQYFPRNDVNMELLESHEGYTTTCPWKGEATYFNVKVGESLNENAAWTYEDPKKEAAQIKGYIAFWNGVQVS